MMSSHANIRATEEIDALTWEFLSFQHLKQTASQMTESYNLTSFFLNCNKVPT